MASMLEVAFVWLMILYFQYVIYFKIYSLIIKLCGIKVSDALSHKLINWAIILSYVVMFFVVGLSETMGWKKLVDPVGLGNMVDTLLQGDRKEAVANTILALKDDIRTNGDSSSSRASKQRLAEKEAELRELEKAPNPGGWWSYVLMIGILFLAGLFLKCVIFS